MVDPAWLTVDFEIVDLDDRHHVGEHAAHLGNLTSASVKLPKGFIITPASYFSFINSDHLSEKINHLLGSIDFNDRKSVEKVARHIKDVINSSKIPEALVSEIFNRYLSLGAKNVKIHTAIVSGDTNQNNFPREYHIDALAGESALIDLLRDAWASIFEPDLIEYRNRNNIDHLQTGVAVTVQEVLAPDSSGKLLTKLKDHGDENKFAIELNGRRYLVNKETLELERKNSSEGVTVYVRDGIRTEEELVDSATTKVFLDVIKQINDPLTAHEIHFAKNDGEIYILGVKPVNIYG